MIAEDVDPADVELRYEVDLRYSGQAFEIPLSLDPAAFAISALTDEFDAEHERLFTFNLSLPHELVNIRAVALGKTANVSAETIGGGDGDPSQAKLRDHELYMDGEMRPAVIYDRAKLEAGDVIPGPAVVIEMDSTTLIHLNHEARVDDHGNLLINPA